MTKEKPPAGSPKDAHYARLRRQHRALATDGGRPHSGNEGRRSRASPASEPAPVEAGMVRLYGLHTVRAALDNPRRVIRRMLVTKNALARMGVADPGSLPFPTEIVEPKAIDRLTGSDAVHQGAMIEAEPLAALRLSDLKDAVLVLFLDQITDPHNVGAIMRSAVAFGAGAVITTARQSPQESGVLAKAASGALELIPHIEVRNLAEALHELAAIGFVTIGLDSEGPEELERTFVGDRIALVLGAEGKGLRQKTRDTVAHLARLDMPGAIKSLNVSNAAAISLYAARKWLHGHAKAKA